MRVITPARLSFWKACFLGHPSELQFQFIFLVPQHSTLGIRPPPLDQCFSNFNIQKNLLEVLKCRFWFSRSGWAWESVLRSLNCCCCCWPEIAPVDPACLSQWTWERIGVLTLRGHRGFITAEEIQCWRLAAGLRKEVESGRERRAWSFSAGAQVSSPLILT